MQSIPTYILYAFGQMHLGNCYFGTDKLAIEWSKNAVHKYSRCINIPDKFK